MEGGTEREGMKESEGGREGETEGGMEGGTVREGMKSWYMYG